jgi:hypothetical protein
VLSCAGKTGETNKAIATVTIKRFIGESLKT